MSKKNKTVKQVKQVKRVKVAEAIVTVPGVVNTLVLDYSRSAAEELVTQVAAEVAPAADQPYNKAVDVLQKAFIYFNEALAEKELDKVPVITIQSKGRRCAYGWFWDSTWKSGDDYRPEINISAEHLSRSAHAIMETLIHEMAHMINAKRKVKDCNASQYHNKNFKATAEAIGLTVSKMGTHGYAKTELGDKARAAVTSFVASNDCSVFDTFNRVDHKRTWRKIFTIPCTEMVKSWFESEAIELGITQKDLVDMIITSYNKETAAVTAAD